VSLAIAKKSVSTIGSVSASVSIFSPGQTLYWILKDGMDRVQESVTYDMPFATEKESADDCSASVRFFRYEYKCGTNGSSRQKMFERTWAFTVPRLMAALVMSVHLKIQHCLKIRRLSVELTQFIVRQSQKR